MRIYQDYIVPLLCFFFLELTPPSALVRETLNTSKTVKACVTFLRLIKPTAESKNNGETKEKPFLEIVALLDLQPGVNGFAGTAHGGLYGVVLDECMGTVTNMQAGKFLNMFLHSTVLYPQDSCWNWREF
jgi:hypothetical protein